MAQEFSTFPPIVDDLDWNAIVGHALEKPVDLLIRLNGSNWEAIYGQGSNQAGKKYGTPGTNPIAVINAAIANVLTPERDYQEKVAIRGKVSILDAHRSDLPIKLPDYTILDLSRAFISDDRTQDETNKWEKTIENEDPTNGNTDITILGGILDGKRGSVVYQAEEYPPYLMCTTGIGISLVKVNFPKVLHTRFLNYAGNGLGTFQTYDGVFVHLNIKNCGGLGGLEATGDQRGSYVNIEVRESVYVGYNVCTSFMDNNFYGCRAIENGFDGFGSYAGALNNYFHNCESTKNGRYGYTVSAGDILFNCKAISNSKSIYKGYSGAILGIGAKVFGGVFTDLDSPKYQKHGLILPFDSYTPTVVMGAACHGNNPQSPDIMYQPGNDMFGWNKGIILGCSGKLEYGGHIASPPAVPASTVSQVNSYGAPATVYIAGGTVTVVKVDGNDIGLTTPCTVRLMPQETVSITYSVAPTWVWIVDETAG